MGYKYDNGKLQRVMMSVVDHKKLSAQYIINAIQYAHSKL